MIMSMRHMKMSVVTSEIDDFSGSDLSEDDDRQFDVDEAEHILASYENDGQI